MKGKTYKCPLCQATITPWREDEEEAIGLCPGCNKVAIISKTRDPKADVNIFVKGLNEFCKKIGSQVFSNEQKDNKEEE